MNKKPKRYTAFMKYGRYRDKQSAMSGLNTMSTARKKRVSNMRMKAQKTVDHIKKEGLK